MTLLLYMKTVPVSGVQNFLISQVNKRCRGGRDALMMVFYELKSEIKSKKMLLSFLFSFFLRLLETLTPFIKKKKKTFIYNKFKT